MMIKSGKYTVVEFEKCIPFVLSVYGLNKSRDYTLSKGQLRIKDTTLKNKVITALRHLCPEKHYYWETSRILRWF